VTEALDASSACADEPTCRDRPDVRRVRRELGADRDHRVARVISIYIALRFEWKFAVPVLIALMHDILITAGIYALVGREVTTSTVAALLTILGFSLYDTIIVFDRIRENVPRMPSAAFSQIVNRSMSEVIVRSLATSFCTGLPVIALFLFGGETLKDFAFALLIGTLSGTYSSVFIAGPLLVHWKEREPVYTARYRRIRDALGHVPAYAVATAGAPVDVEPSDRRRRGVGHRPQDPTQVSREEFDDMVRNLGIDEATEERATRDRAAAAASSTTAGRPAGGRRARARTGGDAPGARAAGDADGTTGGGAATARATSRRSRATAGTGGPADGRSGVGDDGPGASGTSRSSCPTASGRASSARSSERCSARSCSASRSTGSPCRARTTRHPHRAGGHPGALLGIAAVYFYGARQGNEPI
jgi:hypothetical protein